MPGLSNSSIRVSGRGFPRTRCSALPLSFLRNATLVDWRFTVAFQMIRMTLDVCYERRGMGCAHAPRRMALKCLENRVDFHKVVVRDGDPWGGSLRSASHVWRGFADVRGDRAGCEAVPNGRCRRRLFDLPRNWHGMRNVFPNFILRKASAQDTNIL